MITTVRYSLICARRESDASQYVRAVAMPANEKAKAATAADGGDRKSVLGLRIHAAIRQHSFDSRGDKDRDGIRGDLGSENLLEVEVRPETVESPEDL